MKKVSFEIICGTYEEYLIGYLFSAEAKSLTQSFASHDHSSSIRSLATCDYYLGSGASDDRIIIYDLKTRKEHCMLTHHESTITALAFTNNHSHIISASQDGALAIVRCGNWQVEKLWEKAHKGAPILDIAVHPSGKLAFTLATDYTLHTWNLVKGRTAYILNLGNKVKDPKSLKTIQFAPDNIKFLLVGGKFTEIWSIELGGALKVIEHEEKVTSSIWLDNDNIFVGYENGNIATMEINENTKKVKKAHDVRIKAAQYFEGFICTAASDGQVKVWTRKLKEVATVDTGCRLTCMCIVPLMCDIKQEDNENDLSEIIVKKTKSRVSRVVVEEETSDHENYEENTKDEALTRKKKKPKEAVESINLTKARKRKMRESLSGNLSQPKTSKRHKKKKGKVAVV